MADNKNQKIVIIGSGPTGLGCGYRLKELGHTNFRIYERGNYSGGLAHTFLDNKGFRWDVGGHVYFSHYKYFDELFEKMIKNEYQENNRICWVSVCGTWVPYPFQNNLRYLPEKERKECFDGLVAAQQEGKAKNATNFGEFIESIFGAGICNHFMKPYNFKVWAVPPHTMNKEWIGERVAIIDVERARKNIEENSDDFGWGPNNRFKYNFYGSGHLQDKMGEHVKDNIEYDRTLESVNIVDKTVKFQGSNDLVKYDHLVSSMPLDILVSRLTGTTIPENVVAAGKRLRHSSGHIIGIGFEGKAPKNWSWMYFPGSNSPFYRVTYLSNYSPYMTPDPEKYFSLLCEVSFSQDKFVNADTVVQDTIDALYAEGLAEPGTKVVSIWHHVVDYSYPTPGVERDEALNIIIPYLQENNIYSRGRFGMWKYEVANTDHTVMQGVEVANFLVNNEPEITIGIKYQSTVTGHNAAKHEK